METTDFSKFIESSPIISPYSYDDVMENAKYIIGERPEPFHIDIDGLKELSKLYCNLHTYRYLKDRYECFEDSEILDFENPNKCARVINKDCADATDNSITNIVEPTDIESDLDAVLLNCITLDAVWKDNLHLYKSGVTFCGEQYDGIKTNNARASFMTDKNGTYVSLPFDYPMSNYEMILFTPQPIKFDLYEDDPNGETRIYPMPTKLVDSYIHTGEFSVNNMSEVIDVVTTEEFDNADVNISMPEIHDTGSFEQKIEYLDGRYIKVRQRCLIDCNAYGIHASAASMTCCKALSITIDSNKIKINFELTDPFYYFIVNKDKHNGKKTIIFAGHKTI